MTITYDIVRACGHAEYVQGPAAELRDGTGCVIGWTRAGAAVCQLQQEVCWDCKQKGIEPMKGSQPGEQGREN